MAASFGWVSRRLATKVSSIVVPFHKLAPRHHCWYRLASSSSTGAGDILVKPKTDTPASSVVKGETKSAALNIAVKPVLDLPSEDEGFVERFIPISRRSLIRELIQDEFLKEEEKNQFENFATALDSAIVNQYYGNLAELKQLFETINPDKDTISTRKVLQREKLDSEFWLLKKLAVLMETANFHELSESVISKALEEHEAGEGVLVSVNRRNYDVLRFWALGKGVSEEQVPWYKRIPLSLYRRVAKRSAPLPQKYYKRVVVAVRPKGQDKLSLKMFKEVPAGALEHLLPDGKIRMTKFDQGLIATTVSVGALTLLVKAISMLADMQLKWTLIVVSVTGLASLRFWNSYKNRRVKYLMQLSRTLYYKNVANNRGLLALLVDRAQDESFKEALIIYTFLLSHHKPSPISLNEQPMDAMASLEGIRTSGLERNVERWVKMKTGIKIEFDSSAATKLLQAFNIISSKDEDTISAMPLNSALLSLPHYKPSIISRTVDNELEEGYDKVFSEQEELYSKEEKIQQKHGWY